MTEYDLCIVGAGLTGSTAARWATTLRPELRVCLIGPLEPTAEEWNDPTRTVFGTHYDEARIVSEACACRRDSTWPVVVRRSIARYRDIEKESDIKFYHEVGCVFKAQDPELSEIYNMLPCGIPAKKLSAGELSHTFPYLQSDDPNFHSIFETKNAGHINPRKYILANKKIATQNGCSVINDIVSDVSERTDSEKGVCMRLATKSGRIILAGKVLLCAGSFTNFEQLLPRSRLEVDINVMTEMAVLIEISEEEALRMSSMPPILVYNPDATDPRNTYILPPVRYPDGKVYLKVGHDDDLNRPLKSYEDVATWYRNQGQDQFQEFKSILLRIYGSVTGFRPKSLRTMTCTTTTTPTGQFYCDMISPGLGIVTGGNGGGAMSADEIGKMAAGMVIKGAWDSDLPKDEFRVRWRMKYYAPSSKL